MDLQISLFLLFALFTAGHSLNCYECSTVSASCDPIACPADNTNCYVITVGNDKVSKGCGAIPGYPIGSVNLGSISVSYNSCNTDLCNAQDPDKTPNGKTCYYCEGQDCSKTLSCSGTEDHCCTGSANAGIQTLVYKGCVSKSFCDAGTEISAVSNFTCCEGNLCNSVQSTATSTTTSPTTSTTTSPTTSTPTSPTTRGTTSVTPSTTASSNATLGFVQSFLFLCCSLLSFILIT